MQIRVLYHDHCFDGAAAAAFFSRFMEDRFHPGAEFLFTGLAHKASQLFDDSMFDGDENAIVDFKYSPDPRLTWWFDHHQSAFLSPEDAEHFRRDTSGRKMFDPDYRSCTKFIATMAREKFGFDAPDLAELVALGRHHRRRPVRRCEDRRGTGCAGHETHAGDRRREGLRASCRRSSAGCGASQAGRDHGAAGDPGEYRPLYARHLSAIDIIRSKAAQHDGVVFFDLIGHDLEGYNKFIPYYLFPIPSTRYR